MTKITFDISVSVDGYVAGPNQTMEQGLGEGGERLHEWAFKLKAFQRIHGRSGGEEGLDNDIAEEAFANIGAVIMGRRMFSGGAGPWEEDPNANGWWGDEPPFPGSVFVLTHHEREPLELGATRFNFVTDGFESALEQARGAAGDDNVSVAGGGITIQQALEAGAIDEFQLHIAPVFLGGGAPLFQGQRPEVELLRVVQSPSGVVHAKYRVVRN